MYEWDGGPAPLLDGFLLGLAKESSADGGRRSYFLLGRYPLPGGPFSVAGCWHHYFVSCSLLLVSRGLGVPFGTVHSFHMFAGGLCMDVSPLNGIPVDSLTYMPIWYQVQGSQSKMEESTFV